ncbi:SCP2 sterol-binding domain-containing protein [Haloglomus halophilum]|jgi:putative sterol carrier protein|uniref:SCP2 sterol-binding domain-containing protein n=1 Tax=Haloglomus halophilum TaxID=2962672 RepID=UPI0020C9634B|nr:SCP2 sterol-binding domain-containing protein [Haloglomus halophilum]
MTEDLIERIEASLDKPQAELEEELPGLLEEAEGQTGELLREHPVVFGRIVERMESMDIAAFVESNPETADQFQQLLWSGAEVVVEQNESVQQRIAQNITVNFEANDCPMTGHLRVDADEQVVTGGAGHLDDATLEITGPANVLVGLLSGRVEPIPGFMSGQYQMDGSIQHGTQLAPLIDDLSSSIPG